MTFRTPHYGLLPLITCRTGTGPMGVHAYRGWGFIGALDEEEGGPDVA